MNPATIVLMIPIVAIVCGTLIRLSKRDNGESISRDMVNRLAALENEVGSLRQELGETQERLDFTERLLAQEKGINRLGPEH